MINKETEVEKNEKAITLDETKTVTEEGNDKTVPTQVTGEVPIVKGSRIDVSPEIIVNLLQEIKSLFENKIAYDETKEKMFQTLYQQLKEYKEGLMEGIQKPIVKSLLPLYDDIIILEQGVHTPDFDIENLKTKVDVLKSELEEIFYRVDVRPFDEHPAFLDRKLHKTIKVVETSNPEDDNQVAEILKYGFFWKEHIFRPEEVIVKHFKPPKK